ncbi:hypothetical protein PCZ31_2135 [Clostridioides difficile]|nr:hypothetical protein PCZ31_2135 [Clostridioides difficile]
MIQDRDAGWKDYINICKVGGTKSFLDIVSMGICILHLMMAVLSLL